MAVPFCPRIYGRRAQRIGWASGLGSEGRKMCASMVNLDDPLIDEAFRAAAGTPVSTIVSETWIGDAERLVLYWLLESSLLVNGLQLDIWCPAEEVGRAAVFMPITGWSALVRHTPNIGRASACTMDLMSRGGHSGEWVYSSGGRWPLHFKGGAAASTSRHWSWVEFAPLDQDTARACWPRLVTMAGDGVLRVVLQQREYAIPVVRKGRLVRFYLDAPGPF